MWSTFLKLEDFGSSYGQSGRQESQEESDNQIKAKGGTMVLPNQMGDNDNKALGLGYIVKEDKKKKDRIL